MNLSGWIFEAFWFSLPFYFANIAPLFARKLRFLDYPIDNNLQLKGTRLFGQNKTWRGLLFGILAGVITSFFQGRGYYPGFILSLGTLIGDLIGSFIKRQLDLKPGQRNLLFDSTPGTFIPLLLANFIGILTLSLSQSVFLLLVGPLLHILANTLWFKLKIKEAPW